MSFVSFFSMVSEKIYWIFSSYPLWISEVAVGSFFGIVLGLIIYLLSFSHILYMFMGIIIALWLLAYSKIVFFDMYTLKKIIGINVSYTGSEYIEFIKEFADLHKIEIVVMAIMTFAVFRLIKK